MESLTPYIIYARIKVTETCSVSYIFGSAGSKVSSSVGNYYPTYIGDYDESNHIRLDPGYTLPDKIDSLNTNKMKFDTVYNPGTYIVKVVGTKQLVSAVLFIGLKGTIEYLFINPNRFVKQSKLIDENTFRFQSINDIEYKYEMLLIYGITIDNNVKIENLDAPNLDIFIKNMDSGSLIPQYNEQFLDIDSADYNTQYSICNEGMFFNPENEVNAISNKLKGKNVIMPQESTSATYTYNCNKTISKVLMAGGCSIKGAETSSNLKSVVDFDKETKTITVHAIGGNENKYLVNKTAALKIIYSDNTFDTDYFTAGYYDGTCFAKGTKITLFDGSYKLIEDLSYDDLILVYDFIRGKLTYSYPMFLKKCATHGSKLRIILTNDTYFDIVGDHGIYDSKNHKLEWIESNNYDENNIKNMEVFYRNSNNELISTKIKNINYIEEPVEYYTLITAGTQTCFTNDILTIGNRWWQLVGNIQDNHKFDLTNYNYIVNNPELKYNYDRFISKYGQIEKAIYYGSMYDILYGAFEAGVASDKYNRDFVLEQTQLGLKYFWPEAKEFRKDPVTGSNIYKVSFIFKDKHIETKEYHADTSVELPESQNGWYNIVDTVIYKDNFIVYVGTVLEEV